jgi:hypothetical protein
MPATRKRCRGLWWPATEKNRTVKDKTTGADKEVVVQEKHTVPTLSPVAPDLIVSEGCPRTASWRGASCRQRFSPPAALNLAIGFAFQNLSPWRGQTSLAAHWSASWLIVAGMAVRYLADFGGMGLFAALRDRLMTLTYVVSVCVWSLRRHYSCR